MRKKHIMLTVRADMHDAKAIREKIALSGLSQQDFMLKAALGIPVSNPTVFRELLTEYKRQGNNLNQIAKLLNSGHIKSPELLCLIKDLKEEQEILWQLLKQSTQTRA